MRAFRVGIDNYGLYPLGLNPLETLQWAVDHRANGVQFSGLDPDNRKLVDGSYLRDLAQFAGDHGLYVEWGGGQHIPREMTTWAKRDVFANNEQAATEAERVGTRVVRSCSGGLMRWNPENPDTETLLRESAEALKLQRQMLMDHGVILAIETHFEFTTFELRRLFEMCQAEPGEWLGICLDTMNLLTMLEDPVRATERVLPWVVATHIKDGGLLLNSGGLVTFPVEIGSGVIDVEGVVQRLGTLPWDVNLSIEDHGGEFFLPINDRRFLSQFPDLTSDEFAGLDRLAGLSEEKGCKILPRDQWRDVCEERLFRDVLALREVMGTRNCSSP